MADWEDRIKLDKSKSKHFLKGIKTLWKLLGTKRKILLLTVILLFVNQLFNVTLPYFWKLIFDEISKVGSADFLVSSIYVYLIVMFGIIISNLILWHFVIQILFGRSIIYLENFWPVEAQKKLLSLSISYHESENTGSKISKIDKGCDKLVDACCKLFWEFAPQMFYLIANIIFVFFIDWILGLMFFIPYLITLRIGFNSYDRFVDDWHNWEKMREDSSGQLCQSVINVKTVQNFVQECREVSMFSGTRQKMRVLDVGINKSIETFFFWFSSGLSLSFILTICLGIYFISIDRVSVGSIIFMIITGNVIISNIYGQIRTYSHLIRRFVTVERMDELLNLKSDIENKENAVVPAVYSGNIEFSEVSFSYRGSANSVIDKLSLTLSPNKMIAFVGKSGEGKTTLIRLLARMYDVSSGKIVLDNQDIRDLDLYWYRRLFAIVQQDVDIFDGTINDNISYPYLDATQEQIIEAIKAAHLHVMINDKIRFPQGLLTQVGERGVKLSGGEKQRVGIARAYLALLNGAKILILDEATSNLDSEAERAIQQMINQVRSRLNITLVVIAHRLSTIKKADLIYVLEDGHVREQGNHEKLMTKNGLYAGLVELQQLGKLTI
ncbi:hypothetical protein A2223_02970 [Candidatus Falkowbacteria bacterium RIFOXYA2_FULL_35_8]|uniref:ABC transporter domain-containing protein n=1 Tax=Candidatus Falkowbacteria bacterium RIFOXYC2_FULL_36_12 TaxID=1798002 RepID=A0A1F5SYX2_9BACT|nr:MAG: hypothetical protein A2300_03370 [Candidatus Falkowbacteria bacterium RIFOXYB2_FULL_35_7]OGF31917.1 MAG: hypothetical protein A2478_05570 [Candidatus Falkowbacteria bacterium RIFOXYC2_FULL_36_12]OGF34679.1 MAG: hypothetical protein A2223_02970 [Candidatus Falkowbacteria bacterium RIFOXYA2_FULL_35_8]